jgi:hypothetical protein
MDRPMPNCAAPIESGPKTFACRRPPEHDDHGHAICGDISHRHGSTSCEVFGDELVPDSEVLSAVKADLESLDVEKIPGGRTYRALALWLAGTIDKRGDDDGPSVTAKLAERLQATMTALTRKGGDDDGSWQQWEDGISTPVR